MKRLFFTCFTFSILALSNYPSSYRGQDGYFKAEEYTVKVHWAAIYNMNPGPQRGIKSSVRVIPGETLQKNGKCQITHGDKKFPMKGLKFSLEKAHIQSFKLTCTFKSSVNKSITHFEKDFVIEAETPMGKLKVTPVNSQ